MFKPFTTLLACFICCLNVVAQIEEYRFKSWDQQKGMPANSCINVMQDRTGYIWLSTINGISRFNGISFKEFGKHNYSLSLEGEVRKIIQDKKGVYWIASYEKGLFSIDFSKPKEKQIQAFNSSTLPEEDCPPFRTIKCIMDDNKGFTNYYIA
ncbi:MAG: hypothetical protein ABIN89_03100 [Chitinophagaceae bacterium]